MTLAIDIDWECFFTPNFTPGFSATQGWYRPWYLAYYNLGANDTLPKTYQYVPGKTWANKSRDLVVYAEINKTLRFGSTAKLILDVCSDRDIFEISNNEVLSGVTHIGHQLPLMNWPYRVHRINLRAKGDTSMPTNQFVGTLDNYSIQPVSDVKNNNQDGRWRVELNFLSFDHPNGLLGRNRGAPLWYHRENTTTDSYHIAFKSSDNLTFDGAIAQVILWMNKSRPTTDFPVTFSYTPVGTTPYNKTIGSNPVDMQGTVTFTTSSTAVTAAAGTGAFLTELSVGQKIKRTVDGEDKWAYVALITDADNLTLSSAYTGTTGTGGHKIPTTDVVTVDGRSTWEILEKLLAYMGNIEGLGNKYIPTLSATGVIGVTQGGYEKPGALTGTVTFTNNSTAVSGSGTQFTTELVIGQKIQLAGDGVWVYVQSITDNTNLVLTFAYPGTGGAGTALRVQVDEDFRTNYAAQNNVQFTPNIRFNLISVPFTATNNAEYWIKFTLKKGTDVILNIPASGHEYVRYNSNNVHSRKWFKVPTQEANTQYTWIVDLATAGSFAIANVGGYVLSPQTYQFLNSPLTIDYGKINSFIVTRGACYDGFGAYATFVAAGKTPQGCKDGGIITPDGGFEKCTDLGAWGGCYPDPKTPASEPVNPTYGIQGAYSKVRTLSVTNAHDTVCRLHSKKIYQCQLNADSLIRAPINGQVVINNGHTTNLVGGYIEIQLAIPGTEDMIILRVTEQKHIMANGEMPTILKVFRV